MKNKIFLILLSILLVIPVCVSAKEYNEFDIRFEEEIGSNVKNNEIKVFASADDEEELSDKTDDFTMEDVRWYKYVTTIEDGETEDDYDYFDDDKNIYGTLVTDEDVFDENYKYFLYIGRLYAQDEDSFHRNVTINGVGIDEMDGICFNTGNEFFIKTVAKGNVGATIDEEPVVEADEPIVEIDEPITEVVEPVEKTDDGKEVSCLLNNSLCCITFLGLPLCIWILIIIILIILIVVFIKNRRKDK